MVISFRLIIAPLKGRLPVRQRRDSVTQRQTLMMETQILYALQQYQHRSIVIDWDALLCSFVFFLCTKEPSPLKVGYQ